MVVRGLQEKKKRRSKKKGENCNRVEDLKTPFLGYKLVDLDMFTKKWGLGLIKMQNYYPCIYTPPPLVPGK